MKKGSQHFFKSKLNALQRQKIRSKKGDHRKRIDWYKAVRQIVPFNKHQRANYIISRQCSVPHRTFQN